MKNKPSVIGVVLIFCLLLFSNTDCIKAQTAKILRVCIDPGHGGEDSGVPGMAELLEKDVTLQIAKRVKEQLSGYPNVDIVLTRTLDITLNDKERIKRIFNSQPSLVISLHTDASLDTTLSGITIYSLENIVSPILGNEQKQEIINKTYNAAEIIYQIFIKNIISFGVSKPIKADLATYRKIGLPVIMINAGFITNAADELIISKPEGLEEIANSISQAIIGLESLFMESVQSEN
ncbi:MAG: N-acetylmuramoyl-L-alanine amidase [Candidatus Hydrogenedentota bacterium]